MNSKQLRESKQVVVSYVLTLFMARFLFIASLLLCCVVFSKLVQPKLWGHVFCARLANLLADTRNSSDKSNFFYLDLHHRDEGKMVVQGR